MIALYLLHTLQGTPPAPCCWGRLTNKVCKMTWSAHLLHALLL